MRNETKHYVTKNPTTGKLEVICLDTGEVLSNEGADVAKYKYNMETALLVCQEIREGATLKKLSQKLGIDLSVIHYWQRRYPQFAQEMKIARQERAEYFHDKVLELADEVIDRDDVAVARFKTDQYKWAAEKGNPEAYGNKTQVSGSIENKVSMIVLNTGIKRVKPDIEVDYEQKDTSDTGQQISGDIGAGVQGTAETESTSDTAEEES